nr:YceI family protein [Gammaproteobacteria bacterium]
HAYINFQYSHLGLSNPTIGFDDFSMDLNLDNADPTKSTVTVVIDTNSVIAGSPVWHDHITGGKWFDTANHGEITFTSTSIEAAGDSVYKVTGDLTIKGATKPASLMVTINNAMMHPMAGKPVIGLDAAGQVLRSEWGMGANAPHISDEVKLMITAELLQ